MRWLALVIVVWLALGPSAAVCLAAPSDLITQCSKVEYRQQHLAQCNMQEAPGFGLGGGGGQDGLGGLLGGILGGIGGLL